VRPRTADVRVCTSMSIPCSVRRGCGKRVLSGRIACDYACVRICICIYISSSVPIVTGFEHSFSSSLVLHLVHFDVPDAPACALQVPGEEDDEDGDETQDEDDDVVAFHGWCNGSKDVSGGAW
jgi:hypothetical protein